MRIEKFVCDWCQTVNSDNQNFANQVVLVGKVGTERKDNICDTCLSLATDFVLDQIDNGTSK